MAERDGLGSPSASSHTGDSSHPQPHESPDDENDAGTSSFYREAFVDCDYTESGDPPYTDAISTSDSPYTDATSTSDALYTDAISTSDPPYTDAISTDTLFYIASQVADPAGVDVEYETGRSLPKDEPVYFVLDKEGSLESSFDQSLPAPAEENVGDTDASVFRKSKRLSRSRGNVIKRKSDSKKMSEDDCAGIEPADVNGVHESSDQCVALNGIPPAFTGHAKPHGASSTAKEEGIYEITFDSDADTTNSLQNSLGWSGMYESIDASQSPASRPSTYELAKPLQDSGSESPKHLATGCKQGIHRQDFVHGPVPSQQEISEEYNRLRFRHSRLLDEEITSDYNVLNHAVDEPREPEAETLLDEPLYDDPSRNRFSVVSDDGSDASWPSSDFDEEEDEEGYQAEAEAAAPNKPLPRTPSDSLHKLAGLSRLWPSSPKLPGDEESGGSDVVCLPVHINPTKHPPPELPPAPANLTEVQKKCRCVIELTISSERSYIDSLERLVKEYEKPILEVILSPKAHVRVVFHQTREILNHHKMFQIELSESVKKWDKDEKIGDIFTASFSKSMLIDAYSIYVNNFAAGMDEIRRAQQQRPNFEEFLKMKEKSSYDRLSIFGLMVKPIQRFPQFIMLLQDLIKYMPHNHHDRRALQLALTELENVAHKLNERKRLSEQYFQAKQTMHLLPRQQLLSSRNMEKPRRLIRFDNFDQIDGDMENMKLSSRRLILMDDMLICVKVGLKDQDGFMMERYRLKWAARLSDVDLKDMAMTPDMRNVVKMDHKRLAMLSAQLEKSSEDPFHLYSDLRDMLQDLTVFGQITTLMQSLKRSYQGYNMSGELFHEVIADLQRMIQIKDEQLRLVNSCSMILVDHSKTDKPHYVMQSPSPAVKYEWCIDFNMAKLCMEKQNQPGWHRSPLNDDDDLDLDPAIFMKCVPVDVPRNFTKVKCATPVFLPSVPNVSTLGMQHLWVCASTATRGQVSIISLHNTRPSLTESFKACECEILCSEVVPGCGSETNAEKFRFREDTVWMSNVKNEIVIYPLSSSGIGSTTTREPWAVVRVPGCVTCIKFIDERMFCGLDDGAVVVYSRNDAGEWCIRNSRMLQCGSAPVRCQLVIKDTLWIACGLTVFIVAIDSLKFAAKHNLKVGRESSILDMVRCGVGIWMAFQDSATVRLYHIETMDNLQEMGISNIINRVLAEKSEKSKKSGPFENRDCVVTCVTASTGLLWIGTNVGLILALPLPRLKDGVPLYRGRPSVSSHAHRGPVRFIIPVYLSGSLTELHKNSSLRSKLSLRPSMRNRKRQILELEGTKDDKLLSSGTELEASYSSPSVVGAQRQGDRTSKSYAESLPLHHSEEPDKIKDQIGKSTAQRRLFNFKRGSKSNSLKPAKPKKEAKLKASRTLSFRSELANRIRRNTLGRYQARSMFDLRDDDDPNEVERLFDNLMNPCESSSDDEDNVIMENVEDVNVQSNSTNDAVSDAYGYASVKKDRNTSVAGLKSGGKSSVTFDRTSQVCTSSPADGTVSQNPDKVHSTTSDLSQKKSGSVPENKSPTLLPCVAEASCRPDLSLQTCHSLEESHEDAFPLRRMATIRARSMRRTSTSNAVMVLCGGDGYWDMNNGSGVSKNEDASVVFWIYKF